VLNQDGAPIKGLYAASEVVGLYYKTYTGATDKDNVSICFYWGITELPLIGTHRVAVPRK
jgi:hypothetical protein